MSALAFHVQILVVVPSAGRKAALNIPLRPDALGGRARGQPVEQHCAIEAELVQQESGVWAVMTGGATPVTPLVPRVQSKHSTAASIMGLDDEDALKITPKNATKPL